MMESLIERLEDERPRVRAEAAAELVEKCRNDPEARGRWGMRFLTLLNDESPAVRGQAIVGAVLCDEEVEHVERVAKLLADPSPGVRLQAVMTLGPLAAPQLLDAFAVLLGDPDSQVRLTAASALAVEKDRRGLEVLWAALDKRATREEALHALRHLAGVVEDRLLLEAGRRFASGLLVSKFERVAAAGLLAAAGDADGRALLLERVSKKAIDRPLAMELCGELGIGDAVPLLSHAALDKKDPLRGTALRALGSLRAPQAIELCSAPLLDEAEDEDVRLDAVEGLLLLGDSDAHGRLKEAAGRVSSERLRRVIEAALLLFGRPADEIRLYLPLTGDELIS